MNSHHSLTLYSFRRCPYAIRARMALALTQLNIAVVEVKLSNKPQAMLNLSAKGTVPVLHLLESNQVIDESIDIMTYAHQHMLEPLTWQPEHALIKQNDGEFKAQLDRYKYFDRHPEKTQKEHRHAAYPFLSSLEKCLQDIPFLLGNKQSLVDVSIMPFIRQFAKSDDDWWQQQTRFPELKKWLEHHLASQLFLSIMKKDLQKIP